MTSDSVPLPDFAPLREWDRAATAAGKLTLMIEALPAAPSAHIADNGAHRLTQCARAIITHLIDHAVTTGDTAYLERLIDIERPDGISEAAWVFVGDVVASTTAAAAAAVAPVIAADRRHRPKGNP